jgi:nitrous oxidase accessory protein
MNKKFATSLPIVFFIGVYYCGLSVPQLIYAGVHQVSNGEAISAAIEKAEPGDTLFVHEGEYLESLLIDKRLVVIGKNWPHIRGNYKGHVVLVQAAGTVIEGFKISESGTRLLDDMACIRIEADSVTIRNNVITRPLHGIYVKGGSYATISNNYIEGRLDLIPADRGNGIHFWNSHHNRVFGNEILNVRDGIYFSFTDSTEVYQNQIHQVRYGLHYMYSDVNNFTDNIFEKNIAGAALMYSKRILFERNIFAHCRGFRAYGILYQAVDETRAVNNLVIDNSRGVFFDNSNFNRFENNEVVGNDLAFQILGNGEDNVIINNNFINNLSNLLIHNKETHTTWASDLGGNYWSDYKGYDLDGDGLGDIPHRIQDTFQVIETNIPEVRFYRFSPAAEILEIAERTLPILGLGNEKDPLPRFRPIDNAEVPWPKAADFASSVSLFSALAYFMLSLFSLSFVWYMSRQLGVKRS